jgi:two-component system, sensor histidine kinase LadS
MSRQPPRLPLDALKILLVEDSDDIREVVNVLLRAQGADVVAVSTGSEALSAALGADFDVVLTDYGLPDIPGAFVVRQLLAVARQRPLVIVLTGFDEPYTGWARQAGADVVLRKPIDWPRLFAHLLTAPRRAAA